MLFPHSELARIKLLSDQPNLKSDEAGNYPHYVNNPMPCWDHAAWVPPSPTDAPFCNILTLPGLPVVIQLEDLQCLVNVKYPYLSSLSPSAQDNVGS